MGRFLVQAVECASPSLADASGAGVAKDAVRCTRERGRDGAAVAAGQAGLPATQPAGKGRRKGCVPRRALRRLQACWVRGCYCTERQVENATLPVEQVSYAFT